jgi:hypothetical protein
MVVQHEAVTESKTGTTEPKANAGAAAQDLDGPSRAGLTSSPKRPVSTSAITSTMSPLRLTRARKQCGDSDVSPADLLDQARS